MAIGSGAGGSAGVAIGTGALESGGTAVGAGAQALVGNGTAIGENSTAIGRCVALGIDAECATVNTVSVGSDDIQSRVVNVAAGRNDTDAVNMGQLRPNVEALGGGAGFDSLGNFIGPTYNFISGATYVDVGSALYDLDGRVHNLEQNPGGGGQGPAGPAGADGASAYEVAVNNGFTGSETDWLESLHGRDGVDGRDGIDGIDGERGPQGEKGDKGDPGEQGPAGPPGSGDGGQDGRDGVDGIDGRDGIDGQDGIDGRDGVDGRDGTDGIDGERGPQGEKGDKGDAGQDGRSAYELAVEDGFDGSEADWLESLRGADGRDGQDGKDGAKAIAGANIEVSDNEDGSQTVSLADNVELSENGSVSVGTTRMDAQGVHIQGGPSMTRDGIHAGNRRVSGVAPGRIAQGSTDAINGGQMWELEDRWNDRWQDTNRQIERVGAQSAALSMMNGASTHLPVGKVALNVGWGQYGNQSAFAVGAKARLSERSSLAIGFSYSGGKAMGGVGYSLIID